MRKTLLILLTATSLAARAQGTFPNGLLARFPFDASYLDTTGNFDIIDTPGTTFGPDAHGQAAAALQLSGTGQMTVRPGGLLDFGSSGSFSFSVAFRTLSSGTQAFFSNQGTYTAGMANSSRGWSLGFSSTQAGKVFLNLVGTNSTNGGLALATQASYNDGAWHTAAVVVDRGGNTVRLYTDGVAQPLTYLSTNPTYGTVAGTTFTIGSTASAFVDLSPGYSLSPNNSSGLYNRFGLSFNGSLDEARFYNRVLTAAEVQALSAQVLATLSAQAAATQVQVLPNPGNAAEGLTVQLAQAVAASQLQVLDVLGRAVPATFAARPGSQAYTLRGLPAGAYLLRVSLPEGVAVRRFQVE